MALRPDVSRRLLGYAREMRALQTDAEKKLWTILRGRALAGYKFRRQHPIAGYIVDFYCIKRRLAVELDGGQHGDPEALQYDEERTARLDELGVVVIRFSDTDMLKDPEIIAEEILRHLDKPSPQPSPGVPGEGVGGAART